MDSQWCHYEILKYVWKTNDATLILVILFYQSALEINGVISCCVICVWWRLKWQSMQVRPFPVNVGDFFFIRGVFNLDSLNTTTTHNHH